MKPCNRHSSSALLPVLGATLMLLLISGGYAAPARAEEESMQQAVLHIAPSEWEAGSPQNLTAWVRADWKLSRIWVALRPLGSSAPYTTFDLKRSTDTSFAVRLPAELIQPPGIEYYIASENRAGQTVHHFSSPEAPHPLAIRGETELTRMSERLARHNGHRSSFRLEGNYHLFGRQDHRPVFFGNDLVDTSTDRFSDRFWATELEYTYRVLRFLYDFRFGIGVMRGHYPTITHEGETIRPDVDPEAKEPGINYGYGEANFEAHRNFSFGFRLLFGASDEGFAPGIGGLLRIGPQVGTHLELGGEVIADVGSKGYLRFAWTTIPRLPMALTVELSERPKADANPLATLLYYDLGYEVSDALTVSLRGGYAARSANVENGYIAGAAVRYEF